MKIVSWNCHGKFREKQEIIRSLDADIYVIQECENPQKYHSRFSSFNTVLWCGEQDSRGLGIFSDHNIVLKKNPWENYYLRNFLSVRVNDSFDLLGVWACSPYIEEYFIYQAIHFHQYNSEMVIIGDFNSNTKWDRKHGLRNHSAAVKQLETRGLVSAYHYLSHEPQGMETKNTFYLRYNPDLGHYIDHCFISPHKLTAFTVLDEPDIWLKYSDHMPLVLEFK